MADVRDCYTNGSSMFDNRVEPLHVLLGWNFVLQWSHGPDSEAEIQFKAQFEWVLYHNLFVGLLLTSIRRSYQDINTGHRKDIPESVWKLQR